MKRVLKVFLLLCLLLPLTACSKTEYDVSVAGKYVLTDVVYEDESAYTFEEGQGEDTGYYELKDDSTVSLSLFGIDEKGMYQVDGSTVKITLSTSKKTLDFKLDGDKMTYTDPDTNTQFVFEK